MSLTVDLAWVALVLLVSIRLGALFALTPVLGRIRPPATVHVVLLMALAVTLAAALPPPAVMPPVDLAPLALAALSELALGAAMAFGLFAAFGAFQFAGKLLDVQIGFGLGAAFDPVTQTQAPLLGTALGMLASAIFFTLDGHHTVIRGIVYSLERVPAGSWPRNPGLRPFVDQFGSMFVHGLALAAPVVFALLLVDVGVGIVSRTMPQLNVFTLGIPAKIVVGLLVLAGVLAALAPAVVGVFHAVYAHWQRLAGGG